MNGICYINNIRLCDHLAAKEHLEGVGATKEGGEGGVWVAVERVREGAALAIGRSSSSTSTSSFQA